MIEVDSLQQRQFWLIRSRAAPLTLRAANLRAIHKPSPGEARATTAKLATDRWAQVQIFPFLQAAFSERAHMQPAYPSSSPRATAGHECVGRPTFLFPRHSLYRALEISTWVELRGAQEPKRLVQKDLGSSWSDALRGIQ